MHLLSLFFFKVGICLTPQRPCSGHSGRCGCEWRPLRPIQLRCSRYFNPCSKDPSDEIPMVIGNLTYLEAIDLFFNSLFRLIPLSLVKRFQLLELKLKSQWPLLCFSVSAVLRWQNLRLAFEPHKNLRFVLLAFSAILSPAFWDFCQFFFLGSIYSWLTFRFEFLWVFVVAFSEF